MAASVVGHTYPNLTPHAVVTHHIGFYLGENQYVGQRLNAALKVILATSVHSVRSCVSRRGFYLPISYRPAIYWFRLREPCEVRPPAMERFIDLF